MTISSSNRKAGPFTCNGATVAFPFSFKVFTTADVRVVLADASGVESDLALGTNYTVALNADQGNSPGGTVTTTATYATGYLITLTSQVQNLQPLDLTNQGGFYPKVINAALDRLTILVQQAVEQLGRSVKTPISSSLTPDQLISNINQAASNAASSASASASSAAASAGYATNSANSATASANSASAAANSATQAASNASAVGFTITALQAQDKTAFTSAGTAPSFTVTSSPAYGALAANQRMRVKFHAAGTTGSNTLNRDGLGAKNLMQYDYNGTKVSATVAAGMLADVEYDGSDFVILNPLSAGSASGKNRILNGAFDVWQLGTSFTISSHLQKTADRWNFDWNGTLGTMIIQRVNNLEMANGLMFKNGVRLTQTGGASGNTFCDFSIQIESVHTLSGKKATISFYAYSASANNQITVKTEQYFGGGGSPSSPVFNTSSPVTITQGSWNRYSVTFDITSTAAKTLGNNGDDTLNVIFTLPVNTTFDFYICGVQIEEGVSASPFDFRPFSETFESCLRYLQTSYSDQHSPGTVTVEGSVFFTAPSASPVFSIPLRTPMRTLPAITYYNPATGAAGTWNNAGTPVTVTTNTNGKNNISVSFSGVTAGSFVSGHYVLQDPYY